MGGYDQQVVEETVNDMNDFTKKMATLTLGDVIPQLDEDDDAANEDRPWQEAE